MARSWCCLWSRIGAQASIRFSAWLWPCRFTLWAVRAGTAPRGLKRRSVLRHIRARMHEDAHVLPDRLKPGLMLGFCGTAAGRQSALQKAYYAHKQNKFWHTLYEVGLTPILFEAKDYRGLWRLGIGLTDIAKYAYGMDHQLPKDSLGCEAAE